MGEIAVAIADDKCDEFRIGRFPFPTIHSISKQLVQSI